MSTTQFQTTTLKSGSNQTLTFPSRVISASVAIQGYNVSYGSKDHHVKTLEVNASMDSINGSQVTISAICTMEDGSNNKATGDLTIFTIAECE